MTDGIAARYTHSKLLFCDNWERNYYFPLLPIKDIYFCPRTYL